MSDSESNSKSRTAIWVAVITGIFALSGAIITAIVGPLVVNQLQRPTQIVRDVTTDTPTANPPPKSTPIDLQTPSPQEVQTARVQSPQAAGPTYGFFTPKGYLITFLIVEAREVMVTWENNGQERQEQARIIERGGYVPEEITLLQVSGTNLPQVTLPIRYARSLQPGDRVELYISPHDHTPGEVLEVGAQKEVKTGSASTVTINNGLITTGLSTLGDVGAPVVDLEGRVVAVVYGGSQRETISIPIEAIKSSFPEAF